MTVELNNSQLLSTMANEKPAVTSIGCRGVFVHGGVVVVVGAAEVVSFVTVVLGVVVVEVVVVVVKVVVVVVVVGSVTMQVELIV